MQTDYDIVGDLVKEYNIIKMHINLPETTEIGDLILTKNKNHDDVTCVTTNIMFKRSFGCKDLYNIHTNTESDIRLNYSDIYDCIDIDLYLSDSGYRFQLDSIYTLDELEYHTSRTLFHQNVVPTGYKSIYFYKCVKSSYIKTKTTLLL